MQWDKSAWIHVFGDIWKVAAYKINIDKLLGRDEDTSNSEECQVMTENCLQDIEKYAIGAHYLKIDQSEGFNWTSIFVVELKVSDHSHLEFVGAKKN